jgi:hypothetical protein
MHEMGNAMGFSEDHGHDVMSDTLRPGVRDLPAADLGTSRQTIAAMQPPFPGSASLYPVAALDAAGAWGSGVATYSSGNAGATAPIVDWKNFFSGASGQQPKPVQGDGSAWLGDFLGHAGQTEAQRNPNAGIRVHADAGSNITPAIGSL